LDEPALSPCAFLIARGLITEALDFPLSHLGRFARASFGRQANTACKTASLCEPLYRHRPRRTIPLFAAPLIHALQK
jgi:hypothetical protein